MKDTITLKILLRKPGSNDVTGYLQEYKPDWKGEGKNNTLPDLEKAYWFIDSGWGGVMDGSLQVERKDYTLTRTPDCFIWKLTCKIKGVAMSGYVFKADRQYVEPIKTFVKLSRGDEPFEERFFYGHSTVETLYKTEKPKQSPKDLSIYSDSEPFTPENLKRKIDEINQEFKKLNQ